MAKLYLLAFAGLLLAAQLASAAEPTATDPAHKHPKPPSNHTADGKPVKPPGNHTYVPKPKPGKGTWNHTAPTKPTKPGSNHTEWPKASSPTKGSKDITNGPWSKPFKPSKGAKWDNKNSSSSNHSAGGAKPAGRRHGGHDGSSGNSGGKLLNGRKNFFLDPYTPLFTKADKKIAATSTVRFTNQLAREISWFQPLFMANGTQVHLGFWSGPGNHGALVTLLDSININCRPSNNTNCAAWDEGVDSSTQMPSYVEMLVEQWYTRGNAPASSPNVTIYAGNYKNINPLDFPTADKVWGQYSQRYADTARNYYLRTGKRVKAWCFVQGARANRIFYAYEYPELQRLEAEGVVEVACAKTQQASWLNPADWTVGTSSEACKPPAASAMSVEPVNVANRK